MGEKVGIEFIWNRPCKMYFLGTRSYRLKVEMQQITISSPSGFRIGPKGYRSYLTKKFWRKLMI